MAASGEDDQEPTSPESDSADPQTVFGRNLKAARLAAGLSQQSLAALTGLPQPYISLLERGLENPTLETVAKFAEAVGISVQDSLKP